MSSGKERLSGIKILKKNVKFKIMEFLIGSSFSQKVIELLNNAKGSVDVMMYHWPPPRSSAKPKAFAVAEALAAARSRGVKFRVVLNLGLPSDPLREVNQKTANWLRSHGASVKFWRASQTMHIKLILVDRTFLILGSHNLSENAMSKNIEISVLAVGSGEIRKVQDYFNLLWGQI